MPTNSRREWHERIKAVEREFLVARAAVGLYQDAVTKGTAHLPPDVRGRADLVSTLARLEGTYLIRLYAAFEAALRSYWETVRDTKAIKARDLIDGIRAMCKVPDDVHTNVDEVRAFRNALVHESGAELDPIPFPAARGRLQHFLSWLPERW
jgi:hypothetical protein